MKKILLGLAAVFALTVAAPMARAEEPAPAGGEKPAAEKKAKGKKGKKAKEGEAAPAEGAEKTK